MVRVQHVPRCCLCNQIGESAYAALNDYMFNTDGKWSINRCPECKLYWLNPRPINEDIGKLYQKYYTHTTTLVTQEPSLKRQLKMAILAKKFGYQLSSKKNMFLFFGTLFGSLTSVKEVAGREVFWLDAKVNGKLLDVGASNGEFIFTMKQKGWQVYGVEPDPNSAEIAVKQYGLDVKSCPLEDACFPSNYFDAITMSHVIEHLPNPIDTLKECFRILKPDGRLVVTTPNVESWSHKLFKSRWFALEVPRHLTLFSIKSFEKCLKESGFKIITLKTAFSKYIFQASLNVRKKKSIPHHIPTSFLEHIFLNLIGNLIRIFDKNFGDEIILILEKSA